MHSCVNPLLLLLVIGAAWASSEREAAYAHIYQDNHETWYAHIEPHVYEIINPNAFELVPCNARISFTTSGWDMVLYEFEPDMTEIEKELQISDPENPEWLNFRMKTYAEADNDCPMYGKKFIIHIYRVQRKNDATTCISMATAQTYLKYIDNHLRLTSANRTGVDFVNSVISNVCCPCPQAACYAPNTSKDFLNYVPPECVKRDTRLNNKYSSRIFILSGLLGYAGLATVGSMAQMVPTSQNGLWALVMLDTDPVTQESMDYVSSVVIHEFGHTMGMGHGAFAAKSMNFFKTITTVDNYGDQGSVMGGGASWDTPPSVNHYYYRYVRQIAEPQFFRVATEGKTERYRLLAWDHPYSRIFLGADTPRFQEEDLVDGLRYDHHAMTIEIPWNKADMCSTLDASVKYASFFLEYRSKRGLQYGAANHAVHFILGRTTTSTAHPSVSTLLDGHIDNVGDSQGALSVPPEVLWVAPDADKGTVAVYVHRVSIKTEARITVEQLDEPPQPLSKIPYLDIDVTYLPGKRYIAPIHPSPLPSYSFSKNMNCDITADGRGYACTAYGDHYWAYMHDSGFRGHPRAYQTTANTFLCAGCNTIVSFPKRVSTVWNHFYGDISKYKVTITINKKAAGGTIMIHQGVLKGRKHAPNTPYETYCEGDCLFIGSLYALAAGDIVRVHDLTQITEEISTVYNAYYYTFPQGIVQGIQEGFVSQIRNGVIINTRSFYRYVGSNADPKRVAIHLKDSQNIELSPAVYPSNKKWFPSFLTPVTMDADDWLHLAFEGATWEVDDWFFIDFIGVIPEDLVLEVEHDDGVISINCGRIGGFTNITLRIDATDLLEASAAFPTVNRIRFNKEVTIAAVRFVTAVDWGAWGTAPAITTTDSYVLLADGSYWRFTYSANGLGDTTFKPFNTTFNGVEYEIKSDSNVIEIHYPEPSVDPTEKPSSWTSWIITVAIIVVVLLVVIVSVYFIWCRDDDDDDSDAESGGGGGGVGAATGRILLSAAAGAAGSAVASVVKPIAQGMTGLSSGMSKPVTLSMAAVGGGGGGMDAGLAAGSASAMSVGMSSAAPAAPTAPPAPSGPSKGVTLSGSVVTPPGSPVPNKNAPPSQHASQTQFKSRR